MTEGSKVTTIKASRSWLEFELSEIWKYRDLLYLLIKKDFVTSYKQTLLGPFWVLAQALLGSAIFTVIFSKIANISTDGHPAFLFYLSGMLGWQYFASVYGVGCSALQSNLTLFSKVYFPRLIPPLGQPIFAIFNFLIQLAVFFTAFVIYQKTMPSVLSINVIGLLFIPLLVLQTIALGLGIGFIVSALSVKYRDLSRVAGMATQFILYASPIIYPISEIPEKYQSFMAWNPLVFIIESYRHILLGYSTASTLEFALPSVGLTLLVFLTGLILYNKTQRTYVDYA